MKFLLELKNSQITKFKLFIEKINEMFSKYEGVIMTFYKDSIQVIKDEKKINEDYKNFKCEELSSNSLFFPYIIYKIDNNEKDPLSKTFDIIKIEMKDKEKKIHNEITLRITNVYIKELKNIFSFLKSNYIQIYAGPSENQKCEKDDDERYKIVLFIQQLDIRFTNIRSIFIKSIKNKIYDLEGRNLEDAFVNCEFCKIQKLSIFLKNACLKGKENISLEIEVKKNYALLVFQCDYSKFSFITESNDFEGNYESNFAIQCSELYDIIKIFQNLNNLSILITPLFFCLRQILRFEEQDFCLIENTIPIIEMKDGQNILDFEDN